MGSLIVDPKDQKFVLYEMLNVEELCKVPRFADFSRDMFDTARYFIKHVLPEVDAAAKAIKSELSMMEIADEAFAS